MEIQTSCDPIYPLLSLSPYTRQGKVLSKKQIITRPGGEVPGASTENFCSLKGVISFLL